MPQGFDAVYAVMAPLVLTSVLILARSWQDHHQTLRKSLLQESLDSCSLEDLSAQLTALGACRAFIEQLHTLFGVTRDLEKISRSIQAAEDKVRKRRQQTLIPCLSLPSGCWDNTLTCDVAALCRLPVIGLSVTIFSNAPVQASPAALQSSLEFTQQYSCAQSQLQLALDACLPPDSAAAQQLASAAQDLAARPVACRDTVQDLLVAEIQRHLALCGWPPPLTQRGEPGSTQGTSTFLPSLPTNNLMDMDIGYIRIEVCFCHVHVHQEAEYGGGRVYTDDIEVSWMIEV